MTKVYIKNIYICVSSKSELVKPFNFHMIMTHKNNTKGYHFTVQSSHTKKKQDKKFLKS